MIWLPRDQKEQPEWVGVVTKIINDNIEPTLVEVTWSHGEALKHYADDLRPLAHSLKDLVNNEKATKN